MWDEVSHYELRNILHHLLYAEEWDAYERVLLQSDFLEEFITRNGYGLMLDTLESTVVLCRAHPRILENTQNLLQVLNRETGSLDGWQKNEKNHSFFDQVTCSAQLFDVSLALEKSESANQRIHFRVRWKEMSGDEAVRILMPGKRRAVGWDSYDAGWMLPQTTIHIDTAKDVLQTQTSCAYHYGFRDYEYTYYRRDYSLHKCTLLKEYPLVVVSEPYPGNARGPSEILLPEKPWRHRPLTKKLETKIKKHLFASGVDRKAELLVRVLAHSCNTDDLLLDISIKDPSSNKYTHEPFYHLYDPATDNLIFSAVSSKIYLSSTPTKEMVALNQLLYLFYTDSNDDLVRMQVSPRNNRASLFERITSSDADPLCKHLLLVRSATVDVHTVSDGSLVKQVALDEGVWSFNIQSVLCKDGSRFAICIDKMVTQYAIPNAFSQAFEIERHNNHFVLSADLKYYVSGRKVYELGLPTPISTCAVDIEVAPHYQTPKCYISYNNNLYIEKGDYVISTWNLQTGRSIASFYSQLNHWQDSGHLVGYDVSPDERFIISANNGKEILVWDLWNLDQQAGYPHWRLNNLGMMNDIQTVKFFNGGYWILVVTQDQQVYVCSFESDAKILASIRLHQMPQSVHAPVFSKMVIATFSDGSVICYEISADIPGTSVQENGVRFRFNVGHASSVEVTGSFNDWQRLPLIKVEDDWWQLYVPLEKGRYEYKYVIDGSQWQLDPYMCSLPTPFGFNSYVDI